ncbi:MAG: M20 family metallopeptidase [Nitrospinota bacterium]
MEGRHGEEVAALAAELVRIPSPNPPGEERAVAERLEAYLRWSGLEVERDQVAEGRENLLVELAGPRPGRTLSIVNHMDTVPPGEGWTREPFGGELEGGRLWGRGACDMKGGLAAALVAFRALKERADRGLSLRHRVRLCLVVDEEGPFMRGAASLVERGRVGREDAVLSCEPTSLQLVVAQKGTLWFELLVRGRSAHAAAPQEGADAIHAMALALCGLKERAAGLPHSHPRLGVTTVTVGRVEGGLKTNVVPDRCRAEVDARFPPPLDSAGVQQMVEEALAAGCARVSGTRGEVRPISVERPPILAEEDAPAVAIFRRAHREVMGSELALVGVPYYTDAGLIAARTGSRNCFLFGPGSIAQAHAPDEWVALDELRMAARVLFRLLELWAVED